MDYNITSKMVLHLGNHLKFSAKRTHMKPSFNDENLTCLNFYSDLETINAGAT